MNFLRERVRAAYEALELANTSAAVAFGFAAVGVVARSLENRGQARRGVCEFFLTCALMFASAACGLVMVAFVRTNQAAAAAFAVGRRRA